MRQRRPRQYDPDYLARVRQWPCLVCLDNISTEAAHIRYSDARVAKVNPGVGQKPDDKWAVPLCHDCHQGQDGQHNSGERKWWEARGIDPILIALALYTARDDDEAEQIIRAQHPVTNILAAG